MPMPADVMSRRSVLKASVIMATGLSGCASETAETDSSSSPTDDKQTSPNRTTTEGTPTGESPSIVALSVSDYVLYPLAGAHPHVHRQPNTQYVIIRIDSPADSDSLRHRLTLELDGKSVSLADRQPVPWQHDTTDIAFAVAKDETVESGRVLHEGAALRTLSSTTLDRLTNPPVFDVADPSVSLTELSAGADREATIDFRVTNTGDGRGEFGASLRGNFVSGAKTLTATVDAGAERTVTGATHVVGKGDAAKIRLDWGSDQWTKGIPVVGTPQEPETPSPTPAPK
jgi:hypothetical protein